MLWAANACNCTSPCKIELSRISLSCKIELSRISHEAALACYRSPDYQAAKALRIGKAEIDLLVIEGYDG